MEAVIAAKLHCFFGQEINNSKGAKGESKEVS